MKTRWIRRTGEVAGICLGYLLLPLLPRSWITWLSRRLGNLGYRYCRKLREIAAANVELALGGTLSREHQQRIVRDAFRTFCLVALDVFWFGCFSRWRLKKYVKIEPSCEFYLKPGSAVAVTGHLGNWEVLGRVAGVHGVAPVSVAAPVDNPFVNLVVNHLRRGTGQRIARRAGAVRTLMRVLRNGGKTALLIDQNTLPSEGGEFVDFFGLPVPVSKAAEALSERTGAEIVPAFCTCSDHGCYSAYALPPFKAADCTGPRESATQRLAGLMEAEIREHPGQWLWMYKRWKYVPKDRSMEQYPFYAKRVREQE